MASRPPWLAQMAEILQTLNEGVMVSEVGTEILFVNRCLEELIGIPASEIVGRSPRSFFQGQDLEFLFQKIAEVQTAGKARFEFHLPHRDGRLIPVLISAREFEAGGNTRYAVATFADVSELKDATARLEQRQKEIDTELELASRVQQSLVPQALRWGGVSVETYYHPARTIGGDFGLVMAHRDDSLDLLVCDVSGHGIGAALAANRIYTEAASLMKQELELEQLAQTLHRFVLEQIQMCGFFFTMAAARFSDGGRHLSFVGAGHPPAIVLSRSGRTRLLESQSGLLGCIEDSLAPRPVEQLAVERGDRLVLYTDGLTEVFNDRREQFGTDRLLQAAADGCSAPLPAMRQTILDRVASWQNGPVRDDVSLVLAETS